VEILPNHPGRCDKPHFGQESDATASDDAKKMLAREEELETRTELYSGGPNCAKISDEDGELDPNVNCSHLAPPN